MRTFESGATRNSDEGKLDYEGCLSPEVLRVYAEYMHRCRRLPDGSLRASDNWQQGIPASSYKTSLVRHLFDAWRAWRLPRPTDGAEELRERAQLDLLCAVLFNTQGLIFEMLHGRGDQ